MELPLEGTRLKISSLFKEEFQDTGTLKIIIETH